MCEAVVELAILATASAAYEPHVAEEAESIIKELLETVAKSWLSEEGAAIGCSGLGGHGGEGGH